mgnify:CR=1 FL=1
MHFKQLLLYRMVLRHQELSKGEIVGRYLDIHIFLLHLMGIGIIKNNSVFLPCPSSKYRVY